MKEVKTGRFHLDVSKHSVTSKALWQWNDLSWEVVSSMCVQGFKHSTGANLVGLDKMTPQRLPTVDT